MSDDGDHRTESTAQAFSEEPHDSPLSSTAHPGEPVQLDDVQLNDVDDSENLDEIHRRPHAPDNASLQTAAHTPPDDGPEPTGEPPAGPLPGPPADLPGRDDDTAVLPVTSGHPSAAYPESDPAPSYSTPSYSTASNSAPTYPTPTLPTPTLPTSSYPASSAAAAGYPGPASPSPTPTPTPTGAWPPVDSPTQAFWPSPVTPPAPAFEPVPAPMPAGTALGDRVTVDGEDPLGHREVGAGWGGALGLVGLSAAAGGAFALPIVHYAGGHGNDVFFGQLRHLASFAVPAGGDSTSPVGGQLATIWWRYAALGSIGAAALAALVIVTFPRLRRVFGALLFLLGVAMTAMLVLVGAQTNDPQAVTVSLRYDNVRLGLNHLGLGFWVAVGGCAMLAIAGLSALMRQRR